SAYWLYSRRLLYLEGIIGNFRGSKLLINGESLKEVVWPHFNRAIRIDFQGAQITSDTGFLLLREIDDRSRIQKPIFSTAGPRRPHNLRSCILEGLRRMRPYGGGVATAPS